MIISDATPVQFWAISCETYNEKSVFGQNSKCFCQSFECTDDIKFQFQDDVEDDYLLDVFDEDDNLLDSLAFVENPPLSMVPLADGENYGSGTSWVIDADPHVGLTAASKIVRFALIGAKGSMDYEFHYDLTSAGSLAYAGGKIFITLYDQDMVILDQLEIIPGPGILNVVGDITFSASSVPFWIGINSTATAGGASLNIDELTLLTPPFENNVYNLTFYPSINTPDICDQNVYFQIRRASTVLAHSDCVYIGAELEGTVLISYSNERNYAGLISSTGSPDLTFYLRIPAVFAQEQFPETDEPLQLSNNRIISLNSQVKKQKLLDTDYMPMYMHLKIMLALKHQFVTIDTVDYVKEEAYEQKSNSNKKFPWRAYQCWLTEKEYVVRNIL